MSLKIKHLRQLIYWFYRQKINQESFKTQKRDEAILDTVDALRLETFEQLSLRVGLHDTQGCLFLTQRQAAIHVGPLWSMYIDFFL